MNILRFCLISLLFFNIQVKAENLFNLLNESPFNNAGIIINKALCSSPLTQVTGSPFSTGTATGAQGIQYSPDGRFVAVTNRSGEVTMFSVNTDGSLAFIGNFAMAGGTNPLGLAFFPNGNFLAVINVPIGLVTISRVNNNGSLTLNQTISSFMVKVTQDIAISPNGLFAAVSGANDGSVATFTVNPNTGLFTFVGIFSAFGSPFGIEFYPNGQFLAAVNKATNTVTVYNVNQMTGALTPINGTIPASSFATQSSPSLIDISSDGKFAAVTNTGSDTVTIYSIANTGALAPVTGSLATSSFATGSSPLGVSYAPDNSLLVVSNQNSDDISVYSIELDGTLTFITNYPVGDQPAFVDFSPNSVFVGIANSNSDDVSVYATTLQADNISGTTNCNQSIEIASSACGTLPTVSAVTIPLHGTATFSSNSITYTPNNGFSGSDSFTYTVSDPAGRTSSALVNVDVNPNCPPVPPTPPSPTPVVNESAIVRAIRNKYCPFLAKLI